jgi:hypothetical protein
VDDQAVRQVIRGNANRYPVPQNHPYVKLPHPARKFGGNLLSGVELYNEMPAGTYIRDNPLCLCKIIASQSVLQRHPLVKDFSIPGTAPTLSSKGTRR